MIDINKIQNEVNVGKWNGWYKDLTTEPSEFRYSDTVSYELAANFLEDCKTVEDWGCGAGGFLRYRPDAVGVDGSDTNFAQKKFVDLSRYKSYCDGINIRHVFEHNYRWADILRNALLSANRKIVVTMFIPLGDETKELAHNLQHGVDVPDLQISRHEFFDVLDSVGVESVEHQSFESETGYGREEIYYIILKS